MPLIDDNNNHSFKFPFHTNESSYAFNFTLGQCWSQISCNFMMMLIQTSCDK